MLKMVLDHIWPTISGVPPPAIPDVHRWPVPGVLVRETELAKIMPGTINPESPGFSGWRFADVVVAVNGTKNAGDPRHGYGVGAAGSRKTQASHHEAGRQQTSTFENLSPYHRPL